MIDLNRSSSHRHDRSRDIDAAQASLGQSMGLQWAPVRDFSPFPFWTPEQGLHEVNVKATYSIGAPHHFRIRCRAPARSTIRTVPRMAAIS